MASWVEIASLPPAIPKLSKGNLIILIGFNSLRADSAVRYLDKSKFSLYDMTQYGVSRLNSVLKSGDNIVVVDTMMTTESRNIVICTALNCGYKIALVVYEGPDKFYGGSVSVSSQELDRYGSSVTDYVITTPKMISYTMKMVNLRHLA